MTSQVTSLLVITPISGEGGLLLPAYSARGLNQTLEPIVGVGGGGANALGQMLRRTINGTLINLFPSQFRKYNSTISCRDVETPCLDEAYIGQTVEVDCVVELGYLTGASPQRSSVSGSERTEGHFTFYRPHLIMMVTAIRNSFAEFEDAYAWQVDLSEV